MQRITILQYRFTLLSLFLLISNLNLLSILFLHIGNNNIAMAEQQQIQQQQQQTRQGAPLAIVPGLTGNILATVSFLIGTSSFILGLRIQSASRSASPSSTPITQSTLSSSIINKYFDILIFALSYSINSNKCIRNTPDWKSFIPRRYSLFATSFCSFHTNERNIIFSKKVTWIGYLQHKGVYDI